MRNYTVPIRDVKKEGRARRAALWAAAAWATVDTLKKMGSGWLIFGVTAVVMLSMLAYAIVVKFWWAFLLGGIGYAIWSYLKWRKEAYAPVPWDDDYDDHGFPKGY